MRALTVIGPFRGYSGHDRHVRGFVRQFAGAGIRVQLIGMPWWSAARLPAHLRDLSFEEFRKPVPSHVALHFCMPHQVVPFPKLRNVNFTMFEATRAPDPWVERNRGHDLVVVPTESSCSAWIASGMPPERIRVCPLGVDPSCFPTAAPPLPLQLPNGIPVARYRVRFLNVSQLGARKNIPGLLRVWLKATSASDDAVFILKLAGSSQARQSFETQLENIQHDLGKTLFESAPVHFLYDVYSDSEMPRLYAAATHYCSLSFGEGWDQPAMEAAASGLRLIVPGHSAYTAYLDSSIATLISSREVPAQLPASDDAAPLFESASWWQPDEDEAAVHIRSAIRGGDRNLPTAQDRVRTCFTWEQAARRLIGILSELEPPAKRFFGFSFLRRSL